MDMIRELEREMLARDLALVEVTISGISDIQMVDQVIRSGFLPRELNDKTSRGQVVLDAYIDYYVDELNIETVQFWSDGDLDLNEDLGWLQRRGEFIYGTIAGWREFALETAISLPLVLYARDTLYKSMRPRTDMMLFRQATSLTYQTKRKINEYEYLLDDQLVAVPVARYASGMTRGLYYEGNSEFCGTFFYYEPDSTTFLTYESSKTYRNKHAAMFDYDEDHKYVDYSDNRVEKYFKHPEEFPDDLRMTPREYNSFMNRMNQEIASEEDDELDEKKRYVGAKLGLYAIEDEYDQEICTGAREAGIEVIILTHMIGSRQVVPEVLDTRERIDCFSHLVYHLG